MRIYKGKFWIVRFMRRSEGIYMVPNALNSFTLFEGCFAILWVAYVCIVLATYHYEIASLEHHIDAMNLIVWIPLYLGALYAAVGSFFTAPGSLDGGAVDKQWLFHRIIRKPWVINSISMGTPLALVGGVTPCAVLAQNALSRSFEDYQSFAQRVASAISSGSSPNAISPTQYDALVAEAGTIWNNLAYGKRYLSIGFAVWTAFAAVLLLFYIPAGGYMLALVKRQVNLQKDKIIKNEQNNLAILRAEQRQAALDKEPEERREVLQSYADAPDNSPAAANSLLFQPLSKKLPDGRRRPAPLLPSHSPLQSPHQPLSNSPFGRASSTVVDCSPPITPTTAVTLDPHVMEAQQRRAEADDGDVYFPPLRPSQREREHDLASIDSGPVARHRYLRRCFRSLMVLYLGIIFAATIYFVVAARLAVQLYGDCLRGPEASTYLVETSHLPAAWAAVVFGFLTLGAVFFRWFDPAKPIPSEDREKQQKQSPLSGRVKTSNVDGGSARSPDKATQGRMLELQSRSLPAVPESMSQSQSNQIFSVEEPADSSIQRATDTSSSPGRTMKFRLGQDGRKPGALFMMPDVGEQTTFDRDQTETTKSTRSWRSRFGGNHSATRGDAYGTGVPDDVTQTSSVMTDELRSRPDWSIPEPVPSLDPSRRVEEQQRRSAVTQDSAPQRSSEQGNVRPPSWVRHFTQRGPDAQGLNSIALSTRNDASISAVPRVMVTSPSQPADAAQLGEAFTPSTSTAERNLEGAADDVVYPFQAMGPTPTSSTVPQSPYMHRGVSPTSRLPRQQFQEEDNIYYPYSTPPSRGTMQMQDGQVHRSGSMNSRASSATLYYQSRRESIPPQQYPPREGPLPPVPTSPAFGGARVFGGEPSGERRNAPAVVVTPPTRHQRGPSYDFF